MSTSRAALAVVVIVTVTSACTTQQDDQKPRVDTVLVQVPAPANPIAGGDTALLQNAGPSATPIPEPVAPKVSTDDRPEPPRAPSRAKEVERPVRTASGNVTSSGRVGEAAEVATIAQWALIPVTTSADVCTNTHKVGQEFTATVQDSVVGSYGAVIPKNATVTFGIDRIKRSQNVRDAIEIGLSPRILDINGQQLHLEALVEDLRVEPLANNRGRRGVVAGVVGGVGGAVIAKALGASTGQALAVGTGVGAASGATVAATTGTDGCIRANSVFGLRLTNALEMVVHR